MLDHGTHDHETVASEPGAVLLRSRRDHLRRLVPRVGGKHGIFRIVEACYFDRRLCAQRLQGVRGVIGISERESRRAVTRQCLGEHAEIARHRLEESHAFVSKERDAGHKERDQRGAKHRHGHLAFDGEVAKRTHGDSALTD